MKYILITRSFQKQLKQFKRHFSEADVVADIKEFIRTGGGKHTTYLKNQTVADITDHVFIRFDEAQRGGFNNLEICTDSPNSFS